MMVRSHFKRTLPVFDVFYAGCVAVTVGRQEWDFREKTHAILKFKQYNFVTTK